MCTWVAGRYGIRSPSSVSARLTVLKVALRPTASSGCCEGKPIRLHPGAPNNYNPIYEDDYVALGVPGDGGRHHATGHRQLGG